MNRFGMHIYALDMDAKYVEVAGSILKDLDERGTIAIDIVEMYDAGDKNIVSFGIRVRPNVSIEEVRAKLEESGITLL